jgi:hypothetical protein
MAVQIWIGEKPEHPNERRAIMQLASSLARLDGMYIIMANFSVGGRTIDVVVMKQEGIFVVELKHCDGRVIGDVNGPWFVENANKERKRINPGRKNPYNQVITYYYALTNFLSEHRQSIVGSRPVEVRSVRRVVAIAPNLHPDSQIESDWKVQVMGLDALPLHIFTERSADMSWSDEELQRIPQLLNCTRWDEIENLVLSEISPTAAVPITRFRPLLSQLLSTWTGQALIAMSILLLAVALVFTLNTTGTRLMTLPAMPATVTAVSGNAIVPTATDVLCDWRDVQTIARIRQADGTWQSVSAGESAADALLTLTQVRTCDGEIRISLTVKNNTTDLDVRIPLDETHVLIRDSVGTDYQVAVTQSQPAVMQIMPGQSVDGTVVVDRSLHPNAVTLRVTLTQIPFGDASWVVPLVTNAP